MSDPLTATVQIVQLGFSAARAGAAIAGLWASRKATSGDRSEGDGETRMGPGHKEVFLTLSTLAQRLLLLDVLDIDALPDACKSARSAMLAADPDDDDFGDEFDKLDLMLQHLIAAGLVFCAACHPMPIWHGFGCGVLGIEGWSDPGTPSIFTGEVDTGIAILKTYPGVFALLKKYPSRISLEQPFYGEYDKKQQKQDDAFMKDAVKQFEKHGLPPPLPPNEAIQIRVWWFAFATHGRSAVYINMGHSYLALSQFQCDVGRVLYAWTIGEHAELRPWEAILLQNPQMQALAEWLEGLDGTTFKVLRDIDMDWSRIKFKSSSRKKLKALYGNEHGVSNDPFLLVRDPDAASRQKKDLNAVHTLSIAVAKSALPLTSTPPLEPASSPSSPGPPQSPITPTMAPQTQVLQTPQGTPPAANDATARSDKDTPPGPVFTLTLPRKPVETCSTAPADGLAPILPPTPLHTPPSVKCPDPMLDMPPGWEERHLPDGKVYYIDHVTRSTSWTRPEQTAPPGYEQIA